MDAAGSVTAEDENEPFVVRSKICERTRANDLLEALLRECVLPLEDVNKMKSLIAGRPTYVYLCTDRATTNDIVSVYIFTFLTRTAAIASVKCHLEYCWPHGLAIAKSRASRVKDHAKHLSSCVKLLRDGKLKEALVAIFRRVARSKFRVERRARPAEHVRGAKDILDLFTSSAHPDFCFRTNAKGEVVPKQWFIVIQEYLDVMDMSASVPGLPAGLTHYCCADHAAAEAGADVAPCCMDDDEAFEKTFDPIECFVFGSAWENANLERWTWTGKLFMRFMLSNLGPQLFISALKELQLAWRLSDASVVAGLEALLEADNENYTADRNLRLHKVVTNLCCPDILPKMAVDLLVVHFTDRILYRILGDKKSGRCNLFELADPEVSPVAMAVHTLAGLPVRWEPCGHWRLVQALGGDFNDLGIKKYARSQVLQVLCGLMDMCDRMLALFPYAAVHFCKRDAAARGLATQAFLSTCMKCLPHLVQRWRSEFVVDRVLDVDALAHEARFFLESALNTIDKTERSHGQMRTDLHTKGPGREHTASANRTFLREVLSAHSARGGLPELTTQNICNAEDAGDEQDPAALVPLPAAKVKHMNMIRGPLQYCNLQEQLWKRREKRPYAPGERSAVRLEAFQRWNNMSEEEKEGYRHLRVPLVDASAAPAPGPTPRTAEERKKQFQNLWGGGADPRFPIAKDLLHETLKSQKGNFKRPHANDPAIFIRADDVPDRSTHIKACLVEAYRTLRGCGCYKNNMCREHGVYDAVTLREHAKLSKVLCAFADANKKSSCLMSTLCCGLKTLPILQ